MDAIDSPSPAPERAAPASAAFILRAALWFSLAGASAQLLVLAVQRWGLGMLLEQNPRIIWMAPLALAVAMLVPAAVALLAARVAPRFVSRQLVLTTFAFFAALNLTLMWTRLSKAAVLLLAGGIAVQLGRWMVARPGRATTLVRRSLVPMAAAIALLGAGLELRWRWQERRALAALPAAADGSPNVLLIILDTVRAASMGLYGYARNTTPVLSAAARQGVVFDRAIATAPWTLPSHASIMTGAWTHEHSATWHTPLDDSLPTLAEQLAAHGYRTGGFVANLLFTTRAYGLARGFAHYEDYPVVAGEIALNSPLVSTLVNRPALRRLAGSYDVPGRKHAEVVARDFLRWATNGDRRLFFAFLNFMDAHDPYLPRAPFDEAFGPVAARHNEKMRIWGREGGRLRKERMPPDEQRAMVDAYDGGIAEEDHAIGAILDALGASGQLRNTIVIVTADHGEFFGEHALFEHAKTPYLPVIHVPLVILAPGRVPAGTRVPRTVTTRDIAATVVDLAGLSAGHAMPGATLARWWREPSRPDEPVLSELLRDPLASRRDPTRGRNAVAATSSQALLLGRYHFLRGGGRGEELFDVDVDPGELANLRDSATAALILARARFALDSARGIPAAIAKAP